MDLVFLPLQGLRVGRCPGENAFLGSHKVGNFAQLRFSSCEGFLLPPHPQVGPPVSRKRFARSPAGFVILECFSYLIPPPTCCRGQSMDNYETLQWSESHKLRENPIS